VELIDFSLFGVGVYHARGDGNISAVEELHLSGEGISLKWHIVASTKYHQHLFFFYVHFPEINSVVGVDILKV